LLCVNLGLHRAASHRFSNSLGSGRMQRDRPDGVDWPSSAGGDTCSRCNLPQMLVEVAGSAVSAGDQPCQLWPQGQRQPIGRLRQWQEGLQTEDAQLDEATEPAPIRQDPPQPRERRRT
jgi:hypothetical protein